MSAVTYKPLIKLGIEELAARQRSIKPSSGVLFARTADREKKIEARQKILDLFPLEKFPRLHMLTMPSVQWRFERLMLGMRDMGWMQRANPNGTYFTSIENDRSIFFAAVSQMPGLHTSTLKLMRPFPFAEVGVKTRFASLFFANVDDFMRYDWKRHRQNGEWGKWDAAWIDYTGPLTDRRLWLISQFYKNYIRHILIITALKARWDRHTNAAIRKAGDHSKWLRKGLPGVVLHDIEYADIAPMAQFAVQHKESVRLLKSIRGLDR